MAESGDPRRLQVTRILCLRWADYAHTNRLSFWAPDVLSSFVTTSQDVCSITHTIVNAWSCALHDIYLYFSLNSLSLHGTLGCTKILCSPLSNRASFAGSFSMKESEAASDVEERVSYIKGREYASLG
jgi:hypothetical protein